MNHYTSLFKNSKIVGTSRYGEAGPAPAGTLMTAEFELEGRPFIALNGGPTFTFSTGISLFVNCDTQDEGRTSRRGWLKLGLPAAQLVK